MASDALDGDGLDGQPSLLTAAVYAAQVAGPGQLVADLRQSMLAMLITASIPGLGAAGDPFTPVFTKQLKQAAKDAYGAGGVA